MTIDPGTALLIATTIFLLVICIAFLFAVRYLTIASSRRDESYGGMAYAHIVPDDPANFSE